MTGFDHSNLPPEEMGAGHVFHPLGTRESVMAGLANVGAKLCGYCTGSPERWVVGPCDCKYDQTGAFRNGSEQTGCCEVRAAYHALAQVTDYHWSVIGARAFNVVFPPPADAATSDEDWKARALRAEYELAEVRDVLAEHCRDSAEIRQELRRIAERINDTRRLFRESVEVTDNHDPANHHPVGATHQPKRAENEVVSQPEQPS